MAAIQVKADDDITPVIIKKDTNIQTFTPEEELHHLVKRGDWELVLTSQAFESRTPEGQAQVIQEAVDNRIRQLGKSLNYLVNRGPNHHAAAMGVLQRKQQLETIRDDILKNIYEQYPSSLPEHKSKKINFS